jgi:formate dehydrogenase iron-sulfur subunit
VVRAKPPLPAHKASWPPTVVNNVISLASVPVIMDKGAEHYRDFGMGRSRGTIPMQIAGNVKHGGLFETAFGLTLGETGRRDRRRHRDGPRGQGGAGRRTARRLFPARMFDTPFDYEAFAAKDGLIGHAGDRRVRRHRRHDEAGPVRLRVLRRRKLRQVHAVPDRRGARRRRRSTRSARASSRKANRLVADLCNTMKFGSLCALGGFTPYPVMSALTHFPDDFRKNPYLQAAE